MSTACRQDGEQGWDSRSVTVGQVTQTAHIPEMETGHLLQLQVSQRQHSNSHTTSTLLVWLKGLHCKEAHLQTLVDCCSESRLTKHADAAANTQSCSEKLENSLVVCNLVENGAHKKTHNAGKDESGAIVGDISPVADPELPEDHPELHQVGLGVLVLEAEGGRPLLRNTQLLNQLLIFPADANVQISSSGACCGATL